MVNVNHASSNRPLVVKLGCLPFARTGWLKRPVCKGDTSDLLNWGRAAYPRIGHPSRAAFSLVRNGFQFVRTDTLHLQPGWFGLAVLTKMSSAHGPATLNCTDLTFPYLFAVYPTFIVRPKNTTALVDQHVWLHCNASGDPKPKISWSKEEADGYKLDSKRFIQHPNGTLHIKRVRLEDKGRYYCIAANHAVMKQSKFILNVESKSD